MHERIKKLRKALGLTQHEFADRLGISRGNIGSYEVGKSQPGGSVISLICKTFQVNEEWLRTGAGDMFAPSTANALDALVAERGLSPADKALIERFLDLRPDTRRALIDYMKSVVSSLAPEPDPSDVEARLSAMENRLDAFEKEEDAAPAPAPAKASSRTP